MSYMNDYSIINHVCCFVFQYFFFNMGNDNTSMTRFALSLLNLVHENLYLVVVVI